MAVQAKALTLAVDVEFHMAGLDTQQAYARLDLCAHPQAPGRLASAGDQGAGLLRRVAHKAPLQAQVEVRAAGDWGGCRLAEQNARLLCQGQRRAWTTGCR